MNRPFLKAAPVDYMDLEHLNAPKFLITVDTEEEFDWSAPFARDCYGLRHVPAIQRFQDMCDVNGVSPAYLVDYPIATDKNAIELLAGYAAQGRAAIGVQLHPWVSPPFSEEISAYNSFACNLDPRLEREKITHLTQTIIKNMGVKPDIYRAGRYGAGPHTPLILADLGISIDSSVRSGFDYSNEGGPDYSRSPVKPYWLIRDTVIELPVTTVFGGALSNYGNELFAGIFQSDAARSILSRTGLLERIALTPEGIPAHTAIQGIDNALAQNIGLLTFSFHSPSLAPGFTSYVKNQEDLEQFYHWWKMIFAHLDKRGVKPCSVDDVVSLKQAKPSTKNQNVQLPLAS